MVCLRDFYFADDAAITTNSASDLQKRIDKFSSACTDFGLTISLKKTQVIGQSADSQPNIQIPDYTLEVVHDFVYLGSTNSDTLSVDTEISGEEPPLCPDLLNMQVYKACVMSTLLYGSES